MGQLNSASGKAQKKSLLHTFCLQQPHLLDALGICGLCQKLVKLLLVRLADTDVLGIPRYHFHSDITHCLLSRVSNMIALTGTTCVLHDGSIKARTAQSSFSQRLRAVPQFCTDFFLSASGSGEKGLGSLRKEKREKTYVLLDCEPNMQKKLREKVFLDRSQQAGSLGLIREIVDRSFRDLTGKRANTCAREMHRNTLCLNP